MTCHWRSWLLANRDDVSEELLIRLPELAARWRAGEFDAAVLAALYFFHWQMATHGQAFASRKRKSDPRPDAQACLAALEMSGGDTRRARMLDWLERYQFRGVIGNVPVALVQWLRGNWPLVLREDIPKPLELLRMQARGTRAVTAITAWPRLREPVLGKPDGYAFFLHDLEHAYKFFHSSALHAGQRTFFTRIEEAFDRGVFAPYFDDAEFVTRFHYLMSDMNTHPEHSRQYLRAILVEYYLRREHKTLSEPLSMMSESAMVGVMRVMDDAVPPPGDGIGPETPLSWRRNPASAAYRPDA